MSRPPIGHTVLRFDELPSTNTTALETASYLENHGLVLLARHQTAGRGRLGRRWASVPGALLQFSVVVHPRGAPEDVGVVSLAAGLAVARAVEAVCALPARLKWPNDVHVARRKVCGILTELRGGTDNALRLVVGIGINCNGRPEDFPPELHGVLTTLSAHTGAPVEPEPVLQAVLAQLDEAVGRLERGERAGLLADWRERADLAGRPVQAAAGSKWLEGTAEDLSDAGHLVIRLADGTRHVHSAGEVRWLD